MRQKFYITGDTHFGHKRLIEFGRPDTFEERTWKGLSFLKKSDILIHLGDVSLGNDIENHMRLRRIVKGKMWLVKGNHDHKSNTWYLRYGWDFVGKQIRDRYFNKKVVFSHRPLEDDGYDLNIHAHLHDNDHRDEEYLKVKNNKQILFSQEHFDYKPKEIKELFELWKLSLQNTPSDE